MNKKTKAVLIELSIYTILFTLVIILLPMCNFYYEDDIIGMRTEPQYINDFKFAYTFIVYFLMVLFAFLSLNNVLSAIVNGFVLLLMFLSFFFIQMGFHWWGASPYHPDLQLGYYLSQCVLFIFTVRTFSMLPSMAALTITKNWRLAFSILAIVLPVALFVWFLLLTRAASVQA